MALLCEYALTPDVFDTRFYPHEEVGTARLEHLKEVFLEEALLRNLRAGEWLAVFRNHDRPWHRRGTELLKKMIKQNRLRLAVAALSSAPANDVEWCLEALASHQIDPMTGVISTAQIVDAVGADTILGRLDRLGNSPCWTSRSASVRLARCHGDYEIQLRLIMQSANSVMLIDPHLDPSQRRYLDVLPILLLAKGRRHMPLIEIHRVVYVGSGRNRQLIDPVDWENRFREAWGNDLATAGLKVDIFIWDEHHDRYLITDLIGIGMENGYDTTTNPNDITTWSRLGRAARDDIQREFDPAANRHKLRHLFTVP
ncbi:MAG: hypothetical protein FJ117_07875 [Deltaproteobacteria bacterium]|nr:hypothetical protein [Deltaproteobacteria bacterium]